MIKACLLTVNGVRPETVYDEAMHGDREHQPLTYDTLQAIHVYVSWSQTATTETTCRLPRSMAELHLLTNGCYGLFHPSTVASGVTLKKSCEGHHQTGPTRDQAQATRRYAEIAEQTKSRLGELRRVIKNEEWKRHPCEWWLDQLRQEEQQLMEERNKQYQIVCHNYVSIARHGLSSPKSTQHTTTSISR